MLYSNFSEKVLKFKGLDNKNHEVDIKNDDLVIDIKRKLSKEICEQYKNFIFMFKNEILFDDKLISDYKIELNQFVLWFEGEDCVRFSHGDLDIIKCITIIDHYNDDQYFVNMNKRSNIRMLKSIIANKYGLNEKEFYLEFNKNNLSIDEKYKSLEQCGLSDGCIIELFYKDIIKLIINNKYLDKSGEIFVINLSKYSTIGRLKQICAERINVEWSEIALRFNEKCLSDDDATLDRYGLSDGCNIDLVCGNIISVRINTIHGHNKCYCISLNEYSTIGKLKQLIREKYGYSTVDIDLIHAGIHMNNDRRLNYYGINENSTIHMILRFTGGARFFNLSMIPLSCEYKSFSITDICVVNELITEIFCKNNIYNVTIDHSLINLYSDAAKINQIKDFQDLHNYNDHNIKEITIYYEFISKLDRFELIEKLEKGSFGQVYKCRNKNTNQMFALKKFHFSKDSHVKRSFQNEVDCYLKLKPHPRIIKYEKHFNKKHKSFILMEYMERGSLASYVKGKGPFSECRIARYARQILEGLEYLHSNKILHRDLKGDNILLDENDNLKLCDFGLTKILTDLSSRDFLNGVVQSTVGTINWMSPEMIYGKKCGPASDIWSFGATMVEIITRKHPHEGLAIGKIVINILAGKMKFDYPLNSSDDMILFTNSCLKKKPKERASIKDLYQKCFLMKIQT